MNTGNRQTMLQYILWHFETKLQALKGFFYKNEEVQKEMERCETILKNPQEEVDNWIYKDGIEQ